MDFDAQIAAAGATRRRFVGWTRYDSFMRAGGNAVPPAGRARGDDA